MDKRIQGPIRLTTLTILIVLGGCSSTPKGGAAAGTIYVNGDTRSNIYSFDLASGAKSQRVAGADPYPTPQGTILCINTKTQALGEYGADGTTFSIIAAQSLAPDGDTHDDHFQNPQLSPDGQYVAYEGQLGYTFDIYVVARNGGTLLASVNPPAVGEGYVRPTWTPDGLLVVAGGPTNPGLYLSDTTWTNFTRFDQNLASPDQPAVSPDGKTVAFVLNSHIFTVGIDGTGVTQRTTTSGKESWPSWSPDGQSLVFYTDTSVETLALAGGATLDLSTLDANFTTFTVFYGGQMSWR